VIGKTVSHYKILEEIGRGGMGVVYEAMDTKLDRTVALKFLPPDLMRDPNAKERFVHEAKAAAALSHTNICTIHEIDEYEGQSFIAMEYIDGRSLKEMIAEGPLKLEHVMDIAMQIAQGLAEAHEKDIFHRDIKPANIMITGKGQVKIMDFGLAKLRSQTVLTREGTTLGTVAYMSPEQATGEEVDHRADIWSLGVVLYEMVSGQRPFRGEYDQAVIYAVLHDEPEPLTALRTGVPVELERIAAKALEKDPDERYQTAKDFVADLLHLSRIMDEQRATSRSMRPRAPAPREAPPPRDASTPLKSRLLTWVVIVVLAGALAIAVIPRFFKPSQGPLEERTDSGLTMIVVLPFENLGPREDEYFATGITDAITARLAGLSGLGVISRQSAIQYKDSGKSTKEISDELGVDYILEGTIQRERPNDPRSRVRIIPQLIRTADDIHLWAETYDDDMTEVFRLQSDIAERVARELDITLLGQERTALVSKPTDNIEAYEYYLQGIESYEQALREEDARKAVQMFKKAVELDPGFAGAWARLSRAYTWIYWMKTDAEALPRARAAADEALRIDPDLPEGHMALGFLFYYGSRDYEKALEYFSIAQKRRPNDEEALLAIGYIKRRQGHWEEALSNFERARRINPRNYLMSWDNFGKTYIALRRYTDAEIFTDHSISLEPDTPDAYFNKACIAVYRDGDIEKAKEFLQKMFARLDPSEKCREVLYLLPMPLGRICYGSTCEILDQIEPQHCNVRDFFVFTYHFIAKAECSIERNRKGEATAYIDSVHASIKRFRQLEPGYLADAYSLLGRLYARLGRKEEAIREGKRAVELLPISKDAFDGPSMVIQLAEIYTLVGEYEAAIDQLELALSVPSEMCVNLLRLDPMWDPLRDHPRLQKLLEKYSESP